MSKPRKAPTNCQQEPSYPAHETVVMSLRYPNLTAHTPSVRCSIQEPHVTEHCGEFSGSPLEERSDP